MSIMYAIRPTMAYPALSIVICQFLIAPAPCGGCISLFWVAPLNPNLLILIVILIEKKGGQDEQDLQDKDTNQAIAALSLLHPVHPVHPVCSP
jgi:hypothetical protein